MEGEGLKYQDYHPEIKGITIPKMEWTQSFQLKWIFRLVKTWLILFKLTFNTIDSIPQTSYAPFKIWQSDMFVSNF